MDIQAKSGIGILLCCFTLIYSCTKDHAALAPSGNDSIPPGNDSVFKHYNSSNSPLPFNPVTHVVSDWNNNIWLSLSSGSYDGALVKFDGINWIIYNESNSPLPSNVIYALDCDRNNKIWIGTDYGLVSLDNGQWEVVDIPGAPYPENGIWRLKIDSSNAVWIARNDPNAGSNFVKYDAGSWTDYDSLFSHYYIFAMCIDHNNKLWFAASTPDQRAGIFRFDGTAVDTIYLESPPNSSYLSIWNISVDYEGNVWILGVHSYPFNDIQYWYRIFNENTLEENTAFSGFTSDGFKAHEMASTQSKQWLAGAYYIPYSANAIVKCFKDNSWTAYDFANSNLPGPISQMHCICSDHENNIWIGGSNGLFETH